MSSGDGLLVDAPNRPSHQTSGYSLADHRDYLSKAEYALLRNSTALFLTSPFQRMPSPRIPPVDATHQYLLPFLQSPCHPTHSPVGTPQFDVNGYARNYSYGSVTTPYADRGWFEYILLHGLRYFGNPHKSATTDLDRVCETFLNSTRSRVRLIRWTVCRRDVKYGLGRATRRWDGGDRRRPDGLSFIGRTIGTVAF